MASKIRISLVRHGLSLSDLDKAVNVTVADHAVALSDEGRAQAGKAGDHLAGYAVDGVPLSRTAVYVSPYRRTRETWAAMRESLVRHHGQEAEALPVTESIHLRELEFGLFDGIEDGELPRIFPREHALYEKTSSQGGGEFYARMPSGESRCDVAQRVSQFFGTLQRDHERHGVDHAVVVSHGVTIRAFAMMWLGHPVEWYSQQRNPRNASVRTLLGSLDLGHTFAGFEAPRRSAQEVREEGEVA